MPVRDSLCPWQLNTENERWLEDGYYPSMLALGFNRAIAHLLTRQAAGQMVRFGVKREL